MEAAYYGARDKRLTAPLLAAPFTHGELGALLPPGSEALRDHVDDFLARERRSGRLEALKEAYLFAEEEL